MFDLHSFVYDEQHPEDTGMRIVARVEYDEWLRTALLE